MKSVALALIAATGCSTTRLAVRNGEVHRHLRELRSAGEATVETTAGASRVRIDQAVTFDRERTTIAKLAINCPDDAGDTRIEGCALSMFRDETITLRTDRRFSPGTLGWIAVGTGLFAGYGAMAYCAWNCESDKAAGISLVGLGVWAALTVVLGVAQRRANNH